MRGCGRTGEGEGTRKEGNALRKKRLYHENDQVKKKGVGR